jgi:hypothetical protein
VAEIVCDLCGDPTDGYVCRRCSDETSRYVQNVVDLAGEVETNVARLARYAVRGGHRAAEVDDEPVERQANGLRPTPLPVDLNASARAAHAFNTVTTWARAVEEGRGCTLPAVPVGEHPAAVAARFLLANLDWVRHQRFADEANAQLRAAGAAVRRIVDRPPDEEIVGRCECGTYLYAYKGASTVTCPNRECGLRWDVETSRQKLWDALPGYLMTASEAALLLMLHAIGNQDRRRWAKTITMWAQRGLITCHGEIEGGPVYLFGDILERATRGQKQGAA